MASPQQQLIELLKQNKVIPVVGAGVSTASAGLPGWKGLIENGLKYAQQRRLDKDTILHAQELLAQWKLTEAALALKKILNAPKHPFSDWLEQEFGNITFTSKDLLESINALCADIVLTTNYDDLLSTFSVLMPKSVYDWTEHEEIALSIKKNKEFILHLHGSYKKPRTVILGSDDYAALSREKGYKNILQQLWANYHFLFIGCSRDGVMDDDFITVIKFMNKWFPTFPHPHFMLLNQSDIDAGIHEELIEACNIHCVCYGSKREELPAFINIINPNKEKAAAKALKLKEYIDSRLPALMPEKNTGQIAEFLQNVLPKNESWTNSSQISILDEALKAYNKNVASQREKFINYQTIVKGMVNVTDLQNKLDEFYGNRFNPQGIHQKAFIELALTAHEGINRFPKDLLNDVRRKASGVIHSYYFQGYLSSFVHEYNNIKQLPGVDLNTMYGNDEYFFENLARIISSLKELLLLNPDMVYSELEAPEPAASLPKEFVMLGTNKSLTLRDLKDVHKILAKLPLEKNLELLRLELVTFRDKLCAFGYNDQYCFIWDPTTSASADHFFTTNDSENIIFCYCKSEEQKLLITIITNERLLEFVDGEIIHEEKAINELFRLAYSKRHSALFGTKTGDSIYRGPCVFRLNSKKLWETAFTKTQLWELALKFPEIKSEFAIFERRWEGRFGQFPWVRTINSNLLTVNGTEYLSCVFSFSLDNQGGTCLFFFDISKPNLKVYKRIHLPDLYALSVDVVENDYLVLAGQYFKDQKGDHVLVHKIPEKEMSTLQFSDFSYRSAAFFPELSDVKALDKSSIFVNQFGEKLLKVDSKKRIIETLSFTDHERLKMMELWRDA
jgi:hypothetical protein